MVSGLDTARSARSVTPPHMATPLSPSEVGGASVFRSSPEDGPRVASPAMWTENKQRIVAGMLHAGPSEDMASEYVALAWDRHSALVSPDEARLAVARWRG